MGGPGSFVSSADREWRLSLKAHVVVFSVAYLIVALIEAFADVAVPLGAPALWVQLVIPAVVAGFFDWMLVAVARMRV